MYHQTIMKKYIFILIIFFIPLNYSYAEIKKYGCIYETTALGEKIKPKDFMLDETLTVQVDFDKKKLIDYPFKSIANQTKYSKEKAYGVIWAHDSVDWRIEIKTSSKLQKRFYNLRTNIIGGSLTDARKFDDDRYVIHFFDCSTSIY